MRLPGLGMYTRLTGRALNGSVVVLHPVGQLHLGLRGEHHLAVHARRQTTGVALRHPPHAQQRVRARAEHQLLQVADLLEVPRLRRREDPLPQPPYVGLDRAPVDLRASRGSRPLVRSPRRPWPSRRLTCPSGSGASVIFSSQAHLTASARFRARAPGPVSGRLSETDRLEEPTIMSRFPVAFRPPAFASRSSDSRRGVGPSSRSAYRTTQRPGPRRGYRVPHARAATGVGALYTPRTAVLIPAEGRAPAGACRSTAASPFTPLPHPIGRGSLYEASTRVHAIHPSGLPLACGRPDGTGRHLGFPPSFAPRRPGADDARRGGDRPSSTDLELHAQPHQPILQSVFTHCVRPRVARRI